MDNVNVLSFLLLEELANDAEGLFFQQGSIYKDFAVRSPEEISAGKT